MPGVALSGIKGCVESDGMSLDDAHRSSRGGVPRSGEMITQVRACRELCGQADRRRKRLNTAANHGYG